MQVGACFALVPGKPITQYQLSVWKVKDGLPQGSINAILQTKDGYLWLGTQEGLVRFDGVRFTVYDRNSAQAMRQHHVLSLAEDADGSLWIGTFGGGVIRMDHGNFKAYTTREGLPGNIIRSLWVDREERLWIGTEGGGLCSLKGGRIRSYTQADGFSGRIVRAICGDGAGTIWIGSEGAGLYRSEGGRFSNWTVRDGLPDGNIYSLCMERDTLWIGTVAGLARFRNGKIEKLGAGEGPSDPFIRSLFVDKSGVLWVGTNGGGIFRRETGGFSSFCSKDGLPNDGISSIHEDREGNLWLGTNGGGLSRLAEGKCAVFTVREGLPNDLVWAVLESRSGGIWLGTSGGLCQYAGKGFHNYTIRDGLSNNMVWSLLEARDGVLWVGTNGGGLNRLLNGKWTPITAIDGLANNVVTSLLEDRFGRLWIGTRSGLFRKDRGRITPYAMRGRPSSDVIYVLYEDRQGAIWIGTRDGLCRLQDGALTTYNATNGLSNDVVVSLYEDAEGVLWIGTYGGGLNRLQGRTFTSVSRKEGLWDDVVFQILEDASGMLWMSSNKGIFCAKRQDLNAQARGRIPAISCGYFGIADGMRSSECNGGSQPAGCRTRDGRLWFPTVEGVVVIDPTGIRKNPVIPPVVIERVIVDRRSVEAGKQRDFPPGRGEVEFHYSALSFTSPDRVLFKYKLEGYDKDWTDAGTRRAAYYTNLPNGRYTFRVTACNNDGVWNTAGISYFFRLRPHWHQTIPFYIVSGLLVCASVLSLTRLRMKVVEARSAVLTERNRLAREIHDTLAQGFSGIVMQIQAARKILTENPHGAQDHMQKALDLAKRSLEEARRSIWTLRPPAREREVFLHALRTSAHQFMLDPSIDLTFQTEGTPAPMRAEDELNLLRIAQEALANAVRHSGAHHIAVTLRYEARTVRLRVQDDGCGFDMAAQALHPSGGFGLESMRQRVEQLGGALRIQSRPGGGTEVDVAVPVDPYMLR